MRVYINLLIVLFSSATPFISSAEAAKLFILSGQSNMARWDPEDTFRPTLEECFSGEEILIAKFALGGQSIVMWYDSEKPEKLRLGPLFDALVEQVQLASQNKIIDTVSFIWMQGEQDATKKRVKTYETNLTGIVSALQKKVGKKVNVVLGRISDARNDKYWKKIRSIQMNFSYDGKLVPWVNTDDLNGQEDDLHFTPGGYLELGRRFARTAAEQLNEAFIFNSGQ